MNSDTPETVLLKCVKEKGKLRVKIISPGYNHTANCQFPRNLRQEDRTFSVPIQDIKFAQGPRQAFFYRVKKDNIKIIDVDEKISPDTIYEDEDEPDCVVCMSNSKSTVFIPCGHYSLCEMCSEKIQNKCPICRTAITKMVRRDEL